MNTRRWTLVGTLAGMALFVGGSLFLITTSRSPQAPSSSQAQSPFSPQPAATPAPTPDTSQVPPPLRSEADAVPEAEAVSESDVPPRVDAGRDNETALVGRSHQERLKSYEELWTNPDPAALRAAEQDLLAELKQLPPPQLVALLSQGLSTRSANLVLITLENEMRGPRRSEYEDALLAAIKASFEQPERREVLSEVALRFNLSPG